MKQMKSDKKQRRIWGVILSLFIISIVSIAAQIGTTSFPFLRLDGTTAMTGPIVLSAGSAAAPAIGWIDTGFYERAANVLSVTVGNSLRFEWSGNEFRSQVSTGPSVRNEAASATNPVFTGRADADTGVTFPAADSTGFTVGAVLGLSVTEGTNILTTKIFGSQVVKVTDINASTHTVLQTDYYLQVRYTATGVVTVTLPSIATVTNGFIIIIKDSGYNANNFNITVARNGSDSINNVGGNYTISAAGTSIALIANSTTSDWEIW